MEWHTIFRVLEELYGQWREIDDISILLLPRYTQDLTNELQSLFFWHIRICRGFLGCKDTDNSKVLTTTWSQLQRQIDGPFSDCDDTHYFMMTCLWCEVHIINSKSENETKNSVNGKSPITSLITLFMFIGWTTQLTWRQTWAQLLWIKDSLLPFQLSFSSPCDRCPPPPCSLSLSPHPPGTCWNKTDDYIVIKSAHSISRPSSLEASIEHFLRFSGAQVLAVNFSTEILPQTCIFLFSEACEPNIMTYH